MSKRLASDADFDDEDHPDKQRAASSSGNTPQVARVADIVERAFESFFGPQTPERRVFNDAQVSHLMNIAKMDETGEVHAKLMATHKKYNDFMKAYPNIEKDLRVHPYVIDVMPGSVWYNRFLAKPHYIVHAREFTGEQWQKVADDANAIGVYFETRRDVVARRRQEQYVVYPRWATWEQTLDFVHRHMDPNYDGKKYVAIQKYYGEVITSRKHFYDMYDHYTQTNYRAEPHPDRKPEWERLMLYKMAREKQLKR